MHAVARFGERRIDELESHEIAAWRMTVKPGYRFEATPALRQVLARAVVWGMSTSIRPSKESKNPQRRRPEKRPFVDREARVAYVRRSFSKGDLKCTKTEASARSVPLRALALAARDELPSGVAGDLLFPTVNGGYLDLHNFRNRRWKPAQSLAGIEPFRRIDDLRHTFTTFALRAGLSTFDLSRYIGASLTRIDRHYGHLARDGREHAIRLLDQPQPPSVDAGGRSVDAGLSTAHQRRHRKSAASRA